MIVKHRFWVSKSYFITALTYYFFQQGGFYELKKSKALEIVRNRVWWSGRGNWHGDMSIVESLGDGGEAIDVYNEIQPLVEEWVSNSFPNLSNKLT